MPVTTDPIRALLGFAGIIVLLLILITRYRWHVFLALLVPILLFALIPGIQLEAYIQAFQTGFGDTLSSIGVVIILGSIIGEAMKHTGAVEQITRHMVKRIGKTRIPLALTFTGFVLGIAIFGDVAYVIVNPLVHSLGLQFGATMASMSTGLVGALQLTHAIVPPTPGPLAAAGLLQADLGLIIVFGCVVSLVGSLASWAWGLYVGPRLNSQPSLEFVGQSFVEQNRAHELPSTWQAYLPILVPIALMASQSLSRILWPTGNLVTHTLSYLGWPVVALGLGFYLTVRLAGPARRQDAMTGWVHNGLTTAAMIFAVTGLGGSLSAIIRGTPAVDFVADAVLAARIPALFLPFFLGVLVNMITGSSTVGVIAAASLAAPMLPRLGLSPEAAFLAGASGSIIIKYVNSSYFWVCTSLSKMPVNQAILAYGGATLFGGLAAFATTYLLWIWRVI